MLQKEWRKIMCNMYTITASPEPSFHHFTQHSGAATGAAATVHETEAATNGEVATHITIAGFEEMQLHHWSQTKAASHHKEHHRSSADSHRCHRFGMRSFFCRRIVVSSLGSDGFDRITGVILGKKAGISWKSLCLGCCLEKSSRNSVFKRRDLEAIPQNHQPKSERSENDKRN